MKKNYTITIALVISCNVFFSQTPCENGFAGVYPCNDYDLMSRVAVNVFSANEVNDSWGWTDPLTNKEYALVCLNNGLAFVDISSPTQPIYLGKLPTASFSGIWRDVKVYNNHAFVVADVNSHGMQIFDLTRLRNITNPPKTFTTDAHYTGFGNAHNIVINETTGYAYPVGRAGGTLFINIQDPKNPILEGDFNSAGYSHDAQIVTYNGPDKDYTGKEIYIGSNENEVLIADISNKSNPVIISSISYSQASYTHQGWFTEDMRHFIVGDETDELNVGFNTKTIVFDFTDLDNPQLSSTYFGPTKAIDHNGYVKGNSYYLANYTAGMRVLNISNIAATSNAMTEIGYFDTYPENNGANFNGVWSVYPYFDSGNIIISDSNRGLFVVRKSNTLSNETFHQESTSFVLYQNPKQTNPTIKAQGAVLINSLEVYNVLGKKIFAKNNLNLQKFVLPTRHYQNGMYLIKINNTVTKKMLLK